MKNTFPRPGPALLSGVKLLAAPMLAALLIANPLTTSGAHAQAGIVPGTSNGMLTGPVVGAATGLDKKTSPPPALPGARSPDSDPAPMEKPASEMRPNEALFDAVNRGDISAARDALGRGADLGATNVLGLTPVELSVDLGRNDITFLLLSMRGASASTPLAAGDAGKPAAPARTASRSESRHPAPRPAAVAASAPRPAPPPAPRQYADTPGTPVPQAGFLGFGGVTR